jgi:carotenoid 1,2-hydratase
MKEIHESKFAFSSSLKDNVWHPEKGPKAYESWYFDALTDDHRESVVITFLDNYIFSGRYNSSSGSKGQGKEAERGDSGYTPAVLFTYFKDGQPRYRAVQEFVESEFSATSELPGCRIGKSSFKYEKATYGSGYNVVIELPMSGGRRIEAQFEWLEIESDLSAGSFCFEKLRHCWNMVAPRCDVSGKITIYDKAGSISDAIRFRGTGYHDHKIDDRWLAATVHDWHWGRVHFADSTAVFYRYKEIGDQAPTSKLLVVKNGELRERDVRIEEQNYVRDKFGIRYPTRLRLVTEDNMRLRVKPVTILHSGFYLLRFVSEMTLTLRDGIPRRTKGLTEFVAPRVLRYRWLNWLNRLRTGDKIKEPRS